jgi:hypothetical protein
VHPLHEPGKTRGTKGKIDKELLRTPDKLELFKGPGTTAGNNEFIRGGAETVYILNIKGQPFRGYMNPACVFPIFVFRRNDRILYLAVDPPLEVGKTAAPVIGKVADFIGVSPGYAFFPIGNIGTGEIRRKVTDYSPVFIGVGVFRPGQRPELPRRPIGFVFKFQGLVNEFPGSQLAFSMRE